MAVSSAQVSLVRAFNRDYTRRMGLLRQGLLDSRYSLTEVRIMYELVHRSATTAAQLANDLDLDRGYLSRLLQRFERGGWLRRRTSARDARQQHLWFTPAGRRVFAPLEQRAQTEVRQMLATLDATRVRAVLDAMQTIRSSLSPRSAQPKITYRRHQPGDMGWVIARHGELYASQFGWTVQFEALVAQIAAQFLRDFDPARERCWIAQCAGRRLGSIFLVAAEEHTARLRLLLVEPDARGMGVGTALIARCLRFARKAGYRCVELWTQQNLLAARSLYQQAGFVKHSEAAHHSFGHDLIGETWKLDLNQSLGGG